jgi:Leucine-rich repeat (LRR) protein
VDDESYTVVAGNYGPRLELRTAWSAAIERAIRHHGIKELDLNSAKGWRKSDLRFLEAVPDLLAVDILDLTVRDVSAVHCLHELRELGITTYCKTPIDFTAFPHLESVALEWRVRSQSIFQARTLRKVFINRYSGSSLTPFAQLDRLESLRLYGSRIHEIGDVSSLHQLRVLELALARKLSSLDGLEVLTTLEHLEINTCRRIRSIEPIRYLTKLRHLSLDNMSEIETLQPVLALRELESLYFVESSNILDGDIALLNRLPHLRRVSFQNRRHYDCTREELEAYGGGGP